MLNKQELVERLRAANLEALARLAGVSSKTLRRIRDDVDYSPRMQTAALIESALIRATLGRLAKPAHELAEPVKAKA